MFLGMTFAGSSDAQSNVAVPTNAITTLVISNVIADELYASGNVLVNFNWAIPKEWGLDTLLHATYQGNVHAGNVTYGQGSVDAIKIKKRFKGDMEWKTIYMKTPIDSVDDFTIEFYDYFEPSGRDIEYSYVAVMGSVDMESATNEVHSEFNNYFICGQGAENYPLILDVKNEVTYNRESAIITSPGRKYPYVVNNGITQYYSGTLNVTFIAMDENCQLDVENGWKYRNDIDKFLADGQPKILKSFEGDMWLVDVVNSLPRTIDGHYQHVSHQIEWVEVGDPTLVGDLYDNGFINTDIDRE